MTDWETRYYEQQALHTESNGILGQERDRALKTSAENLENYLRACGENQRLTDKIEALEKSISDTSTVRVPVTPTVSMLRPFMGCPDHELELAWNAMLAIVAAQDRRASLRPAASNSENVGNPGGPLPDGPK